MARDRDRNESGQYADGIDPETVLEVVDAREDLARPITAGDVVDELGIARRTAHNKLGALVERGVLETRKIGARGRVWWRPIFDESDHPQPPRDGRESVETASRDGRDQSPREADYAPAAAAVSDDTPSGLLADVDFPAGKDRDQCVDAILAARDVIRDSNGATKAEIIRGVMYDHPLGYDIDAALAKIEAGERYRGGWWRSVVKPGLTALADIEKPARGASKWRYVGES